MSNDKTAVMRHDGPNPGDPLAIISDIHGNLPALRAVFDDIARGNIHYVVCLGDIVGYGPDPVECWRLIRRRCFITIRGNHDQAMGGKDLSRFHPRARTALEWTRRRIAAEADGQEILLALTSLPTVARHGDFLFVHGSPSSPTMEYLLPGVARNRERMVKEFARVERYACNGHTHIPGIIFENMHFLPPPVMAGHLFRLGKTKAIINVGSVGQPRDGDPRACYLSIENGEVIYHRVEYDAEDVCRRILEISELEPFLGQRLLAGY